MSLFQKEVNGLNIKLEDEYKLSIDEVHLNLTYPLDSVKNDSDLSLKFETNFYGYKNKLIEPIEELVKKEHNENVWKVEFFRLICKTLLEDYKNFPKYDRIYNFDSQSIILAIAVATLQTNEISSIFSTIRIMDEYLLLARDTDSYFATNFYFLEISGDSERNVKRYNKVPLVNIIDYTKDNPTLPAVERFISDLVLASEELDNLRDIIKVMDYKKIFMEVYTRLWNLAEDKYNQFKYFIKCVKDTKMTLIKSELDYIFLGNNIKREVSAQFVDSEAINENRIFKKYSKAV